MARQQPAAPSQTERLPGLRERKKRDKRERIHAAALRIFRRDGFEGATTRAIASEAGVAMGTLFRYVRDKRGMLLQVLGDDLQALTEEGCQAAAAMRRGDIVGRVVAFYRPRYVYFHRYPDIGRHFLAETFRAASARTTPAARQVKQRRADMVQELARIIADGRRVPARREDEMAAQMVHALYLTAARQWLESPKPRLADGLAHFRELVGAAAKGLR